VIPLCFLLAGCRQQMASQPSYRPLQPSAFFADGRASRPLVAGTVARGQLQEDVLLYHGQTPGTSQAAYAAGIVTAAVGSSFAPFAFAIAGDTRSAEMPFPVTLDVLRRGQERFGIFCAMCHDSTGSGKGMIVQRGFTPPPSYHTPGHRNWRVGHIFQVITRGQGAMPDYASQIPVEDRWAIVAYVRALQLSQHATLADASPEGRQQLEKGGNGR
jgi:mono/diheme cytochrome c family protein